MGTRKRRLKCPSCRKKNRVRGAFHTTTPKLIERLCSACKSTYSLRVDEIKDGYVCCTGWLEWKRKAWQDHKIPHETILDHTYYINILIPNLTYTHYKGDDGSTLEPFAPQSGDMLRGIVKGEMFTGTITRHIITEWEREKLRDLVSKLKEES